MFRVFAIAILLAAACLATGCGQKGPLTRPTQQGTHAPAPAPASSVTEPDEDASDSYRPAAPRG